MLRNMSLVRSVVRRTIVPRSQVRSISLLKNETENIGDYPSDVPKITRQRRSEAAKWDNQQDRRNFGETLQEEDEILTTFGPDEHRFVSSGTALKHLGVLTLVVLSLVGGVYATFEPLQAVRRTYPYDGLYKELAGRAARS